MWIFPSRSTFVPCTLSLCTLISLTLLSPIGFGRNGDLVANTPIRLLPPNRGGRTVGDQLCSELLGAGCSLTPQSSHKCEYPSIPRSASFTANSGSNTIRVRIGLSSLLCLGIPNLSVCPLRAYAITFRFIIDCKITPFHPKMQVFVKKIQKNLAMSKKSSTFAPAFVRRACVCPFRRRPVSPINGDTSGCHSSVGRAKD